MTELVSISLENEMDLVLAQKKSVKLCELLKLSISTQATFATAVAEIARVVIDFTDSGILSLGLLNEYGRYALIADIRYRFLDGATIMEDSFFYARKLVPAFDVSVKDDTVNILISIHLPRSLNLNTGRISVLEDYFENEPPVSAYEEIKKKNLVLFQIAEDREAELKLSKLMDEQKNEFISIASHELKTPITIIKAYTQLALSGREDCTDSMKGFLRKIDEQSSKLKNLVKQLLDTSKIENGRLEYNYEVVDFNVFIEENTFLVTHLVSDHTLLLESGPEVKVSLAKDRMEQVLTNLISNAAKYSKSGTRITLKTSMSNEGDLLVSVADEGIGMSEETATRIFEKFYRNKQVVHEYSGLGMGLYIASKIVSNHGGKLWVESVLGQGSTFHFSLPVLPRE
ncbi:sensor histidine kinase [Desertivirga xinjiangensis]|uniref:sensor histidine kinase n=1 Tax=Desertivirga xinjiangensis TaxID=539206 RepID=UPI0021092F40|nr:sensor histidine kinase [Pedobacter xinjiangensis]